MRFSPIGIGSLILLFAALGSAQVHPKLSPFEMVRWKGQVPEVQVDGKWYGSVSIDGRAVAKILAHAKDRHGWRWDERFCEDLVQLLSEMGRTPPSRVDLELQELKTKKIIKKTVLMTREKRREIRLAEPRVRGTDKPPIGVVRPKRDSTGYEKLSPFTGVQWTDDLPLVEVEGTWYRVHRMAGASTTDILKHCRTAHPGKWKKRFAEDIVQILGEMNVKHGNPIEVVLENPKGNKARSTHRLQMTRANRRAVMGKQRNRGPGKSGGVQRVKREHAADVSEALRPLIRRYENCPESPMLTADKVRDDLDQLEYLIKSEFSYARLKGLDYEAHFDAIRAGAKDGISLADIHIQLRKLIAAFGDGHARARGVNSLLPRRFAPFGFADIEGKVAAIAASGRAFVTDYPFVKKIDGLPVEKWLDAAAQTAVDGSPQLKRMDSLRYMSFLDYVGQSMGRPTATSVKVTFANKSGRTKTEKVPLDSQLVFPTFRIRQRTGVLEGNVGYLRLANMRSNESFLDSLDAAMEQFRNTKGLIIDVRGNGGGSRQALRRLLPYFLSPEASPRVCNLARYRLHPGDDPHRAEGYMENRFLFPLASKTWGEQERAVIEKFAGNFKPDWQVKEDEFSDWHYMLLGAESNPRAFHYKAPVILLIDGGCFSATDIFAGAFKRVDGVTLMGTTTGGGSGRSFQATLVNSKIRVRLSTMASFQPTGRLYDGVGITPDIEARTTLADWTEGTDSVLDGAHTRLK